MSHKVVIIDNFDRGTVSDQLVKGLPSTLSLEDAEKIAIICNRYVSSGSEDYYMAKPESYELYDSSSIY